MIYQTICPASHRLRPGFHIRKMLLHSNHISDIYLCSLNGFHFMQDANASLTVIRMSFFIILNWFLGKTIQFIQLKCMIFNIEMQFQHLFLKVEFFIFKPQFHLKFKIYENIENICFGCSKTQKFDLNVSNGIYRPYFGMYWHLKRDPNSFLLLFPFCASIPRRR